MTSGNLKPTPLLDAVLHPAWDFVGLFERVFDPLFSICVYLIVILPSGTVFHVNVKMLSYALLFLPAINRLFGRPRQTLLHLGLLLLVPTTLLFWVLIGQLYQFPQFLSVSEYRDIMIMLVSSWLIAVAIGGDQKARLAFLRTALRAEIAACVLKAGLIAYAILHGISVAELVDNLNHLTGTNLMGANLGDASSLGRIQFTADGLIPLCIYLLLRYRDKLRISITNAFLMFVLLAFSLVLTFSRYYWGFACVALALGLLFGKRDRFYAVLLAGSALLITLSLPVLVPIAVLRFSADVAGGSDDARVEQINALERFYWEAPLLGHGLGSHPDDVIRSDDLPYAYEVQLLALACQVGLIGMLFFVAIGGYYFYALFPWNRPWHKWLLANQLSAGVLLTICLLGGLFNPMLLNSAIAVSYGMLKALGEFEEPAHAPLALSNQHLG
jgi:hypothetical protein